MLARYFLQHITILEIFLSTYTPPSSLIISELFLEQAFLRLFTNMHCVGNSMVRRMPLDRHFLAVVPPFQLSFSLFWLGSGAGSSLPAFLAVASVALSPSHFVAPGGQRICRTRATSLLALHPHSLLMARVKPAPHGWYNSQ